MPANAANVPRGFDRARYPKPADDADASNRARGKGHLRHEDRFVVYLSL